MGLDQLWHPWMSSPPPSKRATIEYVSDPCEEASAHSREKLLDQIILGECLKFMKNLTSEFLDCTITSPTYNKNGKPSGHNVPRKEYIANQTEVLNELYRITKPGGHLWYIQRVQFRASPSRFFHPMSWILKTAWTVRQEIVWERPNGPLTTRSRFMECDERIYWLRKEPGPPFELSPEVAKWGTVWRAPPYSIHQNFPHSCTLSLYLVLSILHATNLPNGSLVFDPYGGTGTIAKAAQIANHHYLTVDRDRNCVKTMKSRLIKTSDEDEWWITVLMKQIADGTLNLSMDFQKSIQDSIKASGDFGNPFLDDKSPVPA